MHDDIRTAEFMAHVQAGGKVEATDSMPDDYRRLLIKQIHMHAVSELMGAYPEREWVGRAPTIWRTLALNAKIQDEIGHGQMLLRLVEDLSQPDGRGRDDLLQDLFDGRVKFHNVFHLEAPTWADAGVIGFLVDGGAIITQASLLDTSYAPYARMLKRIVAEESFHMQHGEAVVLALADGTPAQRAMLQAAINRWWPAMMTFFGPPEMSGAAARMMAYRIRTRSNEELRQRFIARYAPRIRALGLALPDAKLALNPESGTWTYTAPDWEATYAMVRNNTGPCSAARLQLRHEAHTTLAWFREATTVASRGPRRRNRPRASAGAGDDYVTPREVRR